MTGARPAAATPAHFNLLTALRGLAALAVVVFHMCQAFRAHTDTPHPLLAFLMPLINYGWFGVDVFFLISGYGLAAKLAGKDGFTSFRGALAFARNRVWRIYPVYWTCCLLAVAFAYAAGHFNHLDWRAEFPPTPGGVLASAFLLEPLTHTPPLLPVVTWTLNCELGFYALVTAGIIFRPGLRDRLLVSLAAGLAGACLLGWTMQQGLVLFFWPDFACGLLVFAAVRLRPASAPAAFRVALAALAGLGLVAGMNEHYRTFAVALVGVALVVVWPFDSALARLRPVRWLAWFGQLSYPLFLIHVPVMSRVVNLSRRVIPADSLAFVLVLGIAAAVAVTVAWTVHRVVELPLQTLARRRALSPA